MAPTKGKARVAATDTEKAKKQAAKRERFIKLGNVRINKAIKAVGLLRNLANRNSYTFTEADVQKLLDPLNEILDSVENAFKLALQGGTAKAEGIVTYLE